MARLITCPYCHMDFGEWCAVDDCTEQPYARGWCYRHYRLWWDAHSDAKTARRPRT